MIKIFIGFVIFAALALFMLMKSDADIDMGGEKHGIEETTHSEPAPAAAAPAPAETPAK
ncbi:hypothetical protein [Hydrogenophaga sp.]|uniref:hypothetical protein n=1 Tax=Hydrogenophaga sp. TaxID=1904254 RepID=UPI00286DF574|nr:hypothetical protein [Hydrogenophaga sp.]